MSRATRCHDCQHMPGVRLATYTPPAKTEPPSPCGCACHATAAPGAAYGPTPVNRPVWPRKALPMDQQVVPLVIGWTDRARRLWPGDMHRAPGYRPQGLFSRRRARLAGGAL